MMPGASGRMGSEMAKMAASCHEGTDSMFSDASGLALSPMAASATDLPSDFHLSRLD